MAKINQIKTGNKLFIASSVISFDKPKSDVSKLGEWIDFAPLILSMAKTELNAKNGTAISSDSNNYHQLIQGRSGTSSEYVGLGFASNSSIFASVDVGAALTFGSTWNNL